MMNLYYIVVGVLLSGTLQSKGGASDQPSKLTSTIFLREGKIDSGSNENLNEGRSKLDKKFSEVVLLDFNAEKGQISTPSVALKTLVFALNKYTLSDGWSVKASTSEKDIYVTGFMKTSLKDTVASYTQAGKVYCEIKDKVVVFRKCEVKLQPIDWSDNKYAGDLVLYGLPLKKTWEEDKRYLPSYTGNVSIVSLLRSTSLNIDNPVNFKNISLTELASMINIKLPKGQIWKVTTNNRASNLKVSGQLKSNLLDSLITLMADSETFHCEIANGIIEFSLGGYPSLQVSSKNQPSPPKKNKKAAQN